MRVSRIPKEINYGVNSFICQRKGSTMWLYQTAYLGGTDSF